MCTLANIRGSDSPPSVRLLPHRRKTRARYVRAGDVVSLVVETRVLRSLPISSAAAESAESADSATPPGPDAPPPSAGRSALALPDGAKAEMVLVSAARCVTLLWQQRKGRHRKHTASAVRATLLSNPILVGGCKLSSFGGGGKRHFSRSLAECSRAQSVL